MLAKKSMIQRFATALLLIFLLLVATPLVAETGETYTPWGWLQEVWSLIIEWIDPRDPQIAPQEKSPTESMGFEIEPNG